MSEKLPSSTIPSSAPPCIHPTVVTAQQNIILFQLAAVFPWNFLNYVKHLPLGTPGRELWLSLPGTTQTALKPFLVLIWYIIAQLLVKFPTTSYFYPSSPGFRWVATPQSFSSSPPTSTPSSSEAQQPTSTPIGRWHFSLAGLPSDPHPLSSEKLKSLFPFCWPFLIVYTPFLVAWIAYISGSIGEPGDDSFKIFTWWISGVCLAAFPFFMYLARDGGVFDVPVKKV